LPDFITVKLIVGLGWLVSLTLHEFSHGLVGYLGGDTGIRQRGYLTWNPLRYADPVLSFILPMLFLLMGGIGLPGGRTYIDRSALRSRHWDSAVSLAGPASNLVLAVLLAVPFYLNWLPGGSVVTSALAFLIMVEMGAVLLNLLPIPPLDGYGILRPYLPPSLHRSADEVGRYGIFVLFIALWYVPPLNAAFWSVSDSLVAAMGVPLSEAMVGLQLMLRWH
jgi:Zn-dependent protease